MTKLSKRRQIARRMWQFGCPGTTIMAIGGFADYITLSSWRARQKLKPRNRSGPIHTGFHGGRWTEREDQVVRAEFARVGHPYEVSGLDRTRAAICSRMNQLCGPLDLERARTLKKNKEVRSLKDEILFSLEAGATLDEVQEFFSVSDHMMREVWAVWRNAKRR